MIKLVCFDLDDTLIKEIHSVMLLCILNGREQEHAHIQQQEESGALDYISADHLRARLIAGLDVSSIPKRLMDIIRPLKNIDKAVQALHSAGMKCLVITVGPKQVAKAISDVWGFDGYYGSDYEVANGHFTGVITKHIGDIGKVECLTDYCLRTGISSDECVAVGDGSTDIPLFAYCGKSIAINASPLTAQKATFAITTDDINDILQFVL